jgi:hypothetical protein
MYLINKIGAEVLTRWVRHTAEEIEKRYVRGRDPLARDELARLSRKVSERTEFNVRKSTNTHGGMQLLRKLVRNHLVEDSQTNRVNR